MEGLSAVDKFLYTNLLKFIIKKVKDRSMCFVCYVHLKTELPAGFNSGIKSAAAWFAFGAPTNIFVFLLVVEQRYLLHWSGSIRKSIRTEK